MEKHDLKILFVEDDDLMRNTISNVLEKNTKIVLQATNGQEGLNIFLREKPEIILTDIMMPVMNGLDMIQEIRQHGNNVKIVVISAYSEKENFLKSIALGINNFLIKPISYKKLLSVLDGLAETILLEKKVEQERQQKQQAQNNTRKSIEKNFSKNTITI